MQKSTRIAVLAAAALALPVVAHAQTSAPAQPAAPAAAATNPQAEMAQLQQKLGTLQQQALQDPGIKLAQDSLTAVLNAGMAKLDPAAPAKVARATALQNEVAAARTANDNAKLNQLATEAQELQAYFAGLQPRALALPEVQAARQAFTVRLFEKMKQLDPNAQQYVDRLTQLRGGSTGGR